MLKVIRQTVQLGEYDPQDCLARVVVYNLLYIH